MSKINNVRIRGISACLPKKRIKNSDLSGYSENIKKKWMQTTGIEERRIVNAKQCTSDLCCKAAQALLNELEWTLDSVGILVFITQTPDYTIPATGNVLQDRLGLSKQCVVFDVNLGCSGYTYGLSIVSSMISAMRIERGLLLVGDTLSKTISCKDRTTLPLFGDAGTATALEYKEGAQPIHFHLCTEGNGHSAIMIREGGFRYPSNDKSFNYEKIAEGVQRNGLQLKLDGPEIFNFSTREVPKSIHELIEEAKVDPKDIDFYVFHQANLFLNNFIMKKLRLPRNQSPLYT